MQENKKHTLIDLFAGCGGLSLGMEHAGFESIFFNEIMPVFASTYQENRKELLTKRFGKSNIVSYQASTAQA